MLLYVGHVSRENLDISGLINYFLCFYRKNPSVCSPDKVFPINFV